VGTCCCLLAGVLHPSGRRDGFYNDLLMVESQPLFEFRPLIHHVVHRVGCFSLLTQLDLSAVLGILIACVLRLLHIAFDPDVP